MISASKIRRKTNSKLRFDGVKKANNILRRARYGAAFHKSRSAVARLPSLPPLTESTEVAQIEQNGQLTWHSEVTSTAVARELIQEISAGEVNNCPVNGSFSGFLHVHRKPVRHGNYPVRSYNPTAEAHALWIEWLDACNREMYPGRSHCLTLDELYAFGMERVGDFEQRAQNHVCSRKMCSSCLHAQAMGFARVAGCDACGCVTSYAENSVYMSQTEQQLLLTTGSVYLCTQLGVAHVCDDGCPGNMYDGEMATVCSISGRTRGESLGYVVNWRVVTQNRELFFDMTREGPIRAREVRLAVQPRAKTKPRPRSTLDEYTEIVRFVDNMLYKLQRARTHIMATRNVRGAKSRHANVAITQLNTYWQDCRHRGVHPLLTDMLRIAQTQQSVSNFMRITDFVIPDGLTVADIVTGLWLVISRTEYFKGLQIQANIATTGVVMSILYMMRDGLKMQVSKCEPVWVLLPCSVAADSIPKQAELNKHMTEYQNIHPKRFREHIKRAYESFGPDLRRYSFRRVVQAVWKLKYSDAQRQAPAVPQALLLPHLHEDQQPERDADHGLLLDGADQAQRGRCAADAVDEHQAPQARNAEATAPPPALPVCAPQPHTPCAQEPAQKGCTTKRPAGLQP